ncbi:thioredoxin family protein [Variovorax sp. J22R133]|uniref:thioredoxin family protein n=1 Tax=Variovorax brevis TaxID=3053503 RepID=UPI0025791EF7|nr:thioredoxin family protein [Variovorax sp. J22R133]MDM0113464.1 thioredoxin family protein [Variovorax sp. J22R133]
MSAVPTSLSAQPAEEALWVVCLCAEWCGACREYRPLFEGVARAHPGFRFAWVDIEDHADIADDFDVETFPTILVASQAGTRFIGPMLPHAETLTRMLSSLPSAQASAAEVSTLLAALRRAPQDFEV